MTVLFQVSSLFPVERVLAVWCPDWPILAAGADPQTPCAVIARGRILSCSPAARAAGVRRGQRWREAQACCPELLGHTADPGRDSRVFEAVVRRVAEVAAGPDVVRPGLLVARAGGAARYWGGEEPLRQRIVDAVRSLGFPVQVGIADGTFAAVQAAYEDRIVPPGRSVDFLAELPVHRLGPPLSEILPRFGLRTLGDFTSLPRRTVVTRWGEDAGRAHDMARGVPLRFLVRAHDPPVIAVHRIFDPPLDRVDTASFIARVAAEELHEQLTRRGLGCLRLVVEVRDESGRIHARAWRRVDAVLPVFSVAAIVDRVRWQLAGWLDSGNVSGGLAALRLVADEVTRAVGWDVPLWDGGNDVLRGQADSIHRHTDIARVLTRLQGLLGESAVVSAVVDGGRDPIHRVRWVPWGSGEPDGKPDTAPWPGRLPPPSPPTVWDPPRPAVVLAASGETVAVTARLRLTATPAILALPDAQRRRITGWAGPWPFDERWWDAPAARHGTRFQFATADGLAWLATHCGGMWAVEGRYD